MKASFLEVRIVAASQASDPAMSNWFRRDVSTVIRISITPSVARPLPDLTTDLILILVLPSLSLKDLSCLSFSVLDYIEVRNSSIALSNREPDIGQN